MTAIDLSEIQGVLFDNDGTLVDTREIILSSFKHATKEVLGYCLPDEEYMKSVGTPLASQMAGFSDDPAVVEELLRAYHAHCATIHDDAIRAYDGMAAALAVLRDAGMKLGVVTSKRHELAWHGLEVVGLAQYFDFLIGADDWPEHKPEPGPVVHGCELMDLDPSKCVYVGDSPFDMISGNGAGTTTVAALWGMFTRDAIAPTSPDYYCNTVGDFTNLMTAAVRLR